MVHKLWHYFKERNSLEHVNIYFPFLQAQGIDGHTQNRFQMYQVVKIKDIQEKCKSVSL